MQESSQRFAGPCSLAQESTRRSLWRLQRITAWEHQPDDTHTPEETRVTKNGDSDELPEPEQLRALVARIQRNDDHAKCQLYQLFNRGIRFQLVRHLGTADIDDKVHDTFLIVLKAIVQDDLRNPERLLGYVRTIVRRQIVNYIQRASARRKEHSDWIEATGSPANDSPEESYLRYEQRLLMRQTLSELGPRDREILVRFYIDEASQETICEEMDLTMTQFRLLKSRAKARFSALGQRQLRPRLAARLQAVAG